VGFRDEDGAQRARIEALERDVEEARAERDRAIAERDRLIAERDRPPGAHRVGDLVHVEWRGSWWPARVIAVVGEREWRIHYEGFGAHWDESVGPSRILPRSATPPGPVRRGGGLSATIVGAMALALVAGAGVAMYLLASGGDGAPVEAVAAPGAPITEDTPLAAGQPVLVESLPTEPSRSTTTTTRRATTRPSCARVSVSAPDVSRVAVAVFARRRVTW
jgi:hypothetical protein